MLKTEYAYLQGKAKWCKTKSVNPWGKWVVTLYPDAPALEKIRDLQSQGMKNVLKKDDDGYFTNFSRPSEKTFTDKSGNTRKVGFAPVQVVDNKGQPFDGLIGNGSDVTVKIEIYTHGTPGGGKAKAARLLGIKVDNLVPYSAKDFDDDQVYQTRGLEMQAEQTAKW